MNAITSAVSNSAPRSSSWGWRVGPRLLCAAAVATAFVVLGLLVASATFARGGRDDIPGTDDPSEAGFLAEIRRTLRSDDDRLIALARPIADAEDTADRLRNQIIWLQVDMKKAEAQYENAKLAREVAEIGIKEYTDGIFPRDLAEAEIEIRLAKSDLDRARDIVGVAKKDMEKVLTRMAENHCARALEQAEGKRKVLVDITKPSRLKELESEVHKTRAEEISRQAEWGLAKGRLEEARRSVRNLQDPGDAARRVVSLVDRAIAVDERVRTALAGKAGDPGIGESRRNEIRGLTNQLGTIIDEAEAVRAADELARLRPRIQKAAGRLGATASK